MNAVLLDTQVFLAIGLNGIEKLPSPARRLIASTDVTKFLSAVSLTEIAIKAKIGKLMATPEQVRSLMADLKLEMIPYVSRHAMKMFDLPLHHREPFDRMLIATAIVEHVPLVGGDEHFPAYRAQGLSVIWR